MVAEGIDSGCNILNGGLLGQSGDLNHEDIELGEHLRIEQVQRRIVDDDAPVAGGLAVDGEAVVSHGWRSIGMIWSQDGRL